MPHRNAFLLCLIPNLLLCAAVFYENYLLLSGNGSSKMQCSLGFALIGLFNVLCLFPQKGAPRLFAAIMAIGLVTAMHADILIDRDFIVGAAMFAVGHLIYYLAQCLLQRPRLFDLLPTAILFLGAAIFLLVQPAKHFPHPSLRWLCLIYAAVIALMAGKAVANWIRVPSLATGCLALGSLLFFFSDVMLVTAWFLGWKPAHLLCMGTYYPAECLLALSPLLVAQFPARMS